MKNLWWIYLLIFCATSTAQIPTRKNYNYTVVEFAPRDLKTIDNLYQILEYSSRKQKDLFNTLDFCLIKISGTEKSKLIKIEAWSNPPFEKPKGFFLFSNKTFFLYGNGVRELFLEQPNKKTFKGKIDLDFDDRYLYWILEYCDDTWSLIEYTD